MKKLTKLIALALVLSLALLALVACDKSAGIKKDFEEAGFTVKSLPASDAKVKAIFTLAGMTEDEIDEIDEYELVFCEKSIYSALYVKFPSAGELKDEFVDDGDTTAYDKAVADGKINGNCWLIYALGDEAETIFLGK